MRATARLTGLFYLALAVAGALGYLTVRPMLFAAGDPAGTLANLTTQPGLARAGIALELFLVLAQSLCAVWFYRLFRPVDPFAAACIAAFGLINGIAVLGSAAALGTAYQIAADPFDGAAGAVQLLYLLGDNLWTAGSIFFGLWLIPMGVCVLRAGGMPRALGWLLIAGGPLYVASAFTPYLLPGTPLVDDLLAIPASIGEIWMVLYLLILGPRGIRTPTPTPAPALT
ncbi:DUF4386 domain-containing protein [Catenuloplanes atrovinosus]|uniref:DUF4386 domain-containing protein n=1 Tax=Catenuloplanes atrovinosus TaxID=137266 RepID=A0AAE3YRX6_9ACTN|nr:DUF4386 domain-containing protein [Catenuloplanes atrovinosus]MDR7277555.1 hypothetical protein [Catenuloplanes atrovinosus]